MSAAEDVRNAAAHAPANDVCAAMAVKLTHALNFIVDAVEAIENRQRGPVMSDKIELLFAETEEYVALCTMRGEGAPRIRVEYDRAGSAYEFAVVVDGTVVAVAAAKTLERAAAVCLERFSQWCDDQPVTVAAALETSLRGAIAERHAGAR